MANTPSASRPAAHHRETLSAIVTLLRGWDADRPASKASRSAPSCAIPQPDATASGMTYGALADQLDANGVQCLHQFHQGIDIAPDDALARLHALDRRYGKASQ